MSTISKSRKPKWKVIFLHQADPLYLYAFNAVLLCFRIRDRQTWDIYHADGDEWKLAFSHHPQQYCRCGKLYNGFKFRDSFFDNPVGLEAQLAWFKLPVLCMSCYYRKENGRGNWIPRSVRRELGLEE